MVVASCGADVVVDSGTGNATQTSCESVAAGCAMLCNNPACAAGMQGADCLEVCKNTYCSDTVCASEVYDALSCTAAVPGCSACLKQASALDDCCKAHPGACYPSMNSTGAAPSGG